MSGFSTIDVFSKDNSISNNYLRNIIYLTIFEILLGIILGIFLLSPLLLLFGILEVANLIILSLLNKASYRMSYNPDLQYDYGYGKYIDLSNISKLIVYLFAILYFSGLLFNMLYNSDIWIKNNFFLPNKFLLIAIYSLLIIILLVKNSYIKHYYSNVQQDLFKDIINNNILLSEEVKFIALSLLGFLISYFFHINQYIVQLSLSVILSALLLYPLIKNSSEYINNILDKNLPEPILFDFLSVVIDNHNQFCEYKSMRTRRSGDNIFIEIDLVMPGGTTIKDSYQLEMKIHNELKSKYPNSIPRIYMTPCNNNCKYDDFNKCPFQNNNK